VPSDSLTIPKDQEETVMALAEARIHRAQEFEFDDFVAGKGRGIIMLLQYDSQNKPICVRSHI
jgi:hypothetical protein